MPDLSTEFDARAAIDLGFNQVFDGAVADVMALDSSFPLGDLSASDLAPSPDLSAADLASPPLVFPSHVAHHYLVDSVTDWTITSNTSIDTGALTITPAAPSGVLFTQDGNLAVLAVHNLTVGDSNTAITQLAVSGSRPLVIVSGGTITVHGLIDAGAHGKVPGPAGSGPDQGLGAGAPGVASDPRATGGGGAGYLLSGAAGGNIGGAAPQGGTSYGTAHLDLLLGGSGGGSGVQALSGPSPPGPSPVPICNALPFGGAGGGGLQVTARVAIQIDAFHQHQGGVGGIISVSGGGGMGGCGGSARSGSGSGGGSGGSLLLEAPRMAVSGRLTAAGGGGGSGGSFVNQVSLNGVKGGDGLELVLPATSSSGGVGVPFRNSGGAGGNDIVLPANAGVAQDGSNINQVGVSTGGGGGALGRIYVRSSGTAQVAESTPATFPRDTTLPATIP